MIDTHCHIDLYPNPELILRECEKAGYPIISMTNLPSHFEKGYPFFRNQTKVRQALGMHPLHAQHHKRELAKFILNLQKTSYIGEIGLDFSKDGITTKEIQLDTFEKILSTIAGQKKLLSIHSRKAEKEVLYLLKKHKIRNAIFHWYSGELNLIPEIVQAGYYFSINPSMTKFASGRKIIAEIPKEFVLTETDGPFVIEQNLPIKPGQVQTVITYLSYQWKLNETEVQNIIWTNFSNTIQRLK